MTRAGRVGAGDGAVRDGLRLVRAHRRDAVTRAAEDPRVRVAIGHTRARHGTGLRGDRSTAGNRWRRSRIFDRLEDSGVARRRQDPWQSRDSSGIQSVGHARGSGPGWTRSCSIVAWIFSKRQGQWPGKKPVRRRQGETPVSGFPATRLKRRSRHGRDFRSRSCNCPATLSTRGFR